MRTGLLLVARAVVLALPPGAIVVATEASWSQEGVAPPSAELILRESTRPLWTASPEKERASMLAMHRLQARGLYAQLFADLGLTEPQIDALTHLIAERDLQQMSASGGGVRFTPNDELAREMESKIASSLGAGGYEKLKAYQETLPEQLQLRRLVQVLVAAGHRLTSEQSAQLVAIVKAERNLLQMPANAPTGTLEHAEELMRNRDEFDRRVKSGFDAVLSPEQRSFSDRYFAARMERRDKALESYRKALSEGSRALFTYQPD